MPSDSPPTPPAKRRPAARRPTILVAEDEDAVRTFVRLALDHGGFTVVATPNGRAAGELFDADPHAFDLVLTDIIMPFVNGVELAARVRARRPDLPVLFMSAFHGGTELAPDPLPPDEPVLEKPFTMARLLEVVNAALGAR